MPWSEEISQRITDVNQLNTAVNAQKTSLNSAVASTEASKNSANTSAVSAAASVVVANTSMQTANTHKEATLSIYGNLTAQQSGFIVAHAAASAAAGSAVAAGVGLVQDLSGVSATALHRSPNAITSMFVYDTSKDSDGGAWTEKCQHTSWYNESLMGKWLGPQPSELNARYEGATIGAEVLTNNSFDLATGWSTSTLTIGGGVASLISASQVSLAQAISLTAGRTYRVVLNIRSHAGGSMWARFTGGTAVNSPVFGTAGRHVFYLTAATGNNNLLFEASGATPQTALVIEDISIREVTALTTSPNDYFQLTTDGKFYRLSKNLYAQTTDLTNVTAWPNGDISLGVRNGTSVRVTDPEGYAYIARPVNSDSFIPGVTYTFSATIVCDQTIANVPIRFVPGNSNPATSSLVNMTAGISQRISLTFTAIATGTTSSRFGVDARSAVVVGGSDATGYNVSFTDPQLEISSTATSYEAKTTTAGSISEVFRGNKQDFPRLAGIVTEAANLTIYDLTEPGRPMWFRYNSPGGGNVFGWGGYWGGPHSFSSIFMSNGIISIGSTNTNAGYARLTLVNLARDSVTLCGNSNARALDAGTITNRAGATFPYITLPLGVGTDIISGSHNAIAMTVLPDAPTDPVTGLKVPTIAIGTNSGVSIIQNTGIVNTIGTADNQRGVAFIGKMLVVEGVRNTVYSQWTADDVTKGTAAIITARNPGRFENESSVPPWLAPSKQGTIASVMSRSGSYKLALSKINRDNATRSLYNHTTEKYNTGWLTGDVRRVYLSDNTPEAIAGPELITNGSFTTNLTGWTTLGTAVAEIVSGEVRVSGPNTYALFQQAITVVPGRDYLVTCKARRGTTNEAWLTIGSASNSGGNIDYINSTSATTVTLIRRIRPTVSTIYISVGTGSVVGDAFFDDVSVREYVSDRSYKAAMTFISGSLIKSQLASGTSLVGYSGFSTSNYLQEPYSADLDFGTGEWNASAWVMFPATIPDSSFPVISSELISGNATVGSGASFSAGELTVTGTVGSTGYWPLSGHTAGKVYRVTFNVLEVQSSGSPITIRTGVAGNAGLYTVLYVSSLGPKTVYFVATSGNASVVTFVRSDTAGGQTRIGSVSTVEVGPAIIFDRAASSGSRLRCGITGTGVLTAEAFDGTTTRTVTTTSAYNTAQWLKADVNYTTDGTLAIAVNGREVGVTRGNPLGSLTLGGKNLIAHSESFDNGVWSKLGASIVANFAVAPNGTNSADLLYPTSNGNNKWTYQSTTGLITNIFSRSVYAKAAGKNFLMIDPDGNGNAAAYFNLSTGEAGTVSTGYTPEIQPAGNGWHRCILRNNTNQSTSFGGVYAVVDADNSRAVTVNGTDGILLWGAQIEVGTPTSYSGTNIAPLTIGNNFDTNAPFPGSIALLKLGATVPTPEQSVFMYEQEKQLFRPGALSILPDANTIIDMSYDDATDRWAAISTTNESYWSGLVRNSVTAVPAGSYSKITTNSGIKLASRITTDRGVDISIPPYALREELVKRAETANKLVNKLSVYDYVGGFTGNITTGSTSILSVTSLTYPTTYIGARISGTGIPANTFVTGVSGTTIYISAAASATTTGATITFLDFILPVGMEAKIVMSAGVIRREGSTFDYTRIYDGFKEAIRFSTAPGSTAWVQIQAKRITQ